jgi:hypothetical protein
VSPPRDSGAADLSSSVGATTEESKDMEVANVKEDNCYISGFDGNPSIKPKTEVDSEFPNPVSSSSPEDLHMLNMPGAHGFVRVCVMKEGYVTCVHYMSPQDQNGDRRKLKHMKDCLKEAGLVSGMTNKNFSLAKRVLGLQEGYETCRKSHGCGNSSSRYISFFNPSSRGLKEGKRFLDCTLCNTSVSYANISVHMRRWHLPDESCPKCSLVVPPHKILGHVRSCGKLFKNEAISHSRSSSMSSVCPEDDRAPGVEDQFSSANISEGLLGKDKQEACYEASSLSPSSLYLISELPLLRNRISMKTDVPGQLTGVNDYKLTDQSNLKLEDSPFEAHLQTFSSGGTKNRSLSSETTVPKNTLQQSLDLRHCISPSEAVAQSVDTNFLPTPIPSLVTHVEEKRKQDASEVEQIIPLNSYPEANISGNTFGLNSPLESVSSETFVDNHQERSTNILAETPSITPRNPRNEVRVTLLCQDPSFSITVQSPSSKPISKAIKKFAKKLNVDPSTVNCMVGNKKLTGEELAGDLRDSLIQVTRKDKLIDD